MQLLKRVIPLAKDRALVKFNALARQIAADAEAALQADMAEPRIGMERMALCRQASQYLRARQADFATRITVSFRDGVERGVRTMYTDLRANLGSLTANTLSLIDDEAVNRQMEVGHLTQRLRDACDENLGRLNIMIAQLHGDADVLERENPFRPYLIARALYETLKADVPEEAVRDLLFEYLSNALDGHLPAFYAAICDVFDAHGVQARLMARPTRLKKHQRDQLARQLAEMNASSQPGGIIMGGAGVAGGGGGGNGDQASQLNPQVMPALMRMFSALQGAQGAAGAQTAGAEAQFDGGRMAPAGTDEERIAAFQEKIWNFFNPAPATDAADASPGAGMAGAGAGQAGAGSGDARPAPSVDLLRQLDAYQREAVADAGTGAGAGGAVEAGGNQLFSVGERLQLAPEEIDQRVAIDVVAVLFEFILEDEQIPAVMRARIGRLQIPFLKAAMLEPQLLQQQDHPARQLLNRIASAAVGLEPDSEMAQALDAEIARLVRRILEDFTQDVGIFSDCLHELEHFLAERLANADAETARSIQAAEEAEKFSAILRNTEASLRGILEPIDVDQRVKDFILEVWTRVLVRAGQQDSVAEAESNLANQYREILPDLVWSALDKNTPTDRSALMRMLPGLVKRMRIGMLMLNLPEEECKAALDKLVPAHTRALRTPVADEELRPVASLEDLRREFSRLVLGSEETAGWVLTEPLQVDAVALEGALAQHGAEAELALEQARSAAMPSAELLAQLRVGNCVECRIADVAAPARLIWVSKHHTLFIFKMDQQVKPLVYSSSALLEALQSGKIRLLEYAPAFDRAVDALMMGAEAVKATH